MIFFFCCVLVAKVRLDSTVRASYFLVGFADNSGLVRRLLVWNVPITNVYN
jgi:hypothetical protein